ncbi:MAG TPA: histidine phosphatase family protein [Baekduia sp.]|nr:histidine phosphatase family protein [Baekduia sp.]
MAREVWLVRHAETEWSKTHRHTGRTDVPLTDTGRRHAEALRERLADASFAAVLVSPLSRARETAELAGLGSVAQVREDLVEFDYGEYEGITTTEIRKTRPGWLLWRDGSPGGETPDDVGARADRIVAEALAADGDGDVALIAHGHVLRVVAARWLEQPASFGGRLALATGALCRLGFERETRVIRAWNV